MRPAKTIPAQSQKGGNSLKDFDSHQTIFGFLQQYLKVPPIL